MANRVKQVTVSPADRVELERRVRSQTGQARDARRARIVLLAAEGRSGGGDRRAGRGVGADGDQVAPRLRRSGSGGACRSAAVRASPRDHPGAAEAIRAFHLDALGSAVALNVDCDVVLTVLADAVCAALARRLPGYEHATPDLLQRRFLDTEGTIHTHGDRVVVRLKRRAYTPVLRAADLPDTPCPGGAAAPCTSTSPNRGRIRCVMIGANRCGCGGVTRAGRSPR